MEFEYLIIFLPLVGSIISGFFGKFLGNFGNFENFESFEMFETFEACWKIVQHIWTYLDICGRILATKRCIVQFWTVLKTFSWKSKTKPVVKYCVY